jgi:ankyrin repeat protein
MGETVLRRVLSSVLLLGLFAVPDTVGAQDLRLITAAAAGDAGAVRVLIAGGADVDARRADGATALLWAAHRDDLEMVDLLLRAGAGVNAADDNGVTPLERAAENASPAMVEKLLAAGAGTDVARDSGLTPLMTAARTGHAGVVETLLRYGANVDAATAETRSTALMWAVAGAHPAVARALIDAGADPHASTADGFTPLLYAAHNGDIAMAETLIAAGVDVNDTGVDGTHALVYSIVVGNDAFALYLLEKGADPNGSMGGVRALHAAAGSVTTWHGDWRRRHGDSRRRSPFGRRGLHAGRALPLVEALLARGANPNARITASAMLMDYIGYPRKGAFEPFACGTGDLRGATPLWVAAHEANRPTVPDGAEADYVRDSAAIIRALLDAGADQHLTTDDGTTPFMAAAGLGRSTYRPRQPRGARSPSAEAAVRVLLEAGADINAVNEADFNALHGAAFRGLDEVVTYLVEQGADIDARDFKGRTAFRLAEGSKQSFQFQSWPETAALLRRLGANVELGIPGTVQERLRDVPAAVEQ